MSSSAESTPWMIVAGDFRRGGGMDRANFELAHYLLERGERVHLVANTVAPELRQYPLAQVHLARRPLKSFLLGSRWLDQKGRQVARKLRELWPSLPVIVNGANCMAGDINWSHYVHSAWAPSNQGMPAWLHAKHAFEQRRERSREREAYRRARLILTNSNLTKSHIEQCLGGPSNKIRTVYLGVDESWAPVTSEQRTSARTALGLDAVRPIALFVGAVGYDNRKGLDILVAAWKELCKEKSWDVDLLVAGGGRALEHWRAQVQSAGLQDRIRLLGFVGDIPKLLAAADVLVSPVRYEAYGLNVQEALCHAISVIVSAGAGVAERFPKDYQPLLLDNPENISGCVAALKRWRVDIDGWKARSLELSYTFRARSWRKMAAEITDLVAEVRSRHALASDAVAS